MKIRYTAQRTQGVGLYLFTVLMTLSLAYPVHAQERSVTIIGAGAVASSGGYLGEKTNIFPVPMLVLRRGNWFFEGIQGGYRFVETDRVQFDALLAPRFGPFEADDDPGLAGMRDRNTTLEGGARVKLTPIEEIPIGIGLEAGHDLFGEHSGMAAALSLSYAIDRGWWAVTPRVGINWYDDDLMMHLAGVHSSEVRPGRNAYIPGAETSFEAGVNARFPISRKWSFFGIASWEEFGDRYTRSPIVTSNSGWTAILGLAHVFGTQPTERNHQNE